jgi:hypothetical protein
MNIKKMILIILSFISLSTCKCEVTTNSKNKVYFDPNSKKCWVANDNYSYETNCPKNTLKLEIIKFVY